VVDVKAARPRIPARRLLLASSYSGPPRPLPLPLYALLVFRFPTNRLPSGAFERS
jgi:hypothetical protein